MKYLMPAACAVILLSACAMPTTYKGQVVSQVAFRIDGGKTLTMPMVRGGALPSENEDYKIEVAGYLASLKAGDAAQSEIRQSFSFLAKKNPELEYVRIEQVDGEDLQLVVQDDAPVLKRKMWIGQTKPIAASKEAAPWLYSNGNSIFLFKFTIKAKGSQAVVMYQPSFFNQGTKATYLRVIQGPVS